MVVEKSNGQTKNSCSKNQYFTIEKSLFDKSMRKQWKEPGNSHRYRQYKI